MQIKDMFAKDINREIQGVIIVGQGEDVNVAQELEEYVVTRELQRHFADFFEAYKKGILGQTPKMGVWISGFFGSGKSHFLKILSYLLDNRVVAGKHALDYFIDDKKIVDSIVLGNMQLAADTPTDVILFNIDSKSDSDSKHGKDAIVNVFLRVFNEMQGFCGAMPHLADLERKLTEEGRFEAFKAAFEENTGDQWEDSRQDFDFIQDDVVDCLVDIDFMSEAAARNWCEKAAEPYRISIEDFAKRVRAYIEAKGNNHHVVFLVDEIGQYIGEDSNLMLDLQTVTEELGKECLGKAWVVVTSQQDIDSITHVRGNDFSKIQGRFDTRLSLSSANVDAVIKQRILQKTPTAEEALGVLYEQKATVIKNLITFNDGIEKKLYSGPRDFCEVYPFVPYQFNLLGSVLTSIRTHGASGKHLSEGERSMLALFKESAMALKEKQIGSIIPFHCFYDALENFLDHSHRGVILKAYDNEFINPEQKAGDVFAVDVLKTLFMIKYVKEIEPNLDNITSLMIGSLEDDRIELKGRVEEALKILIRQTLVQRNKDLYVFLTDEEQEINNEIEKENVETSEVINKVAEIIFEEIFRMKKYQYPSFGGRYTFSFNQAVDDRPYKSVQNFDIGVRILTPDYEGSTEPETMRLMSSQSREVLVVLPANDGAFLDEVRTAMKIDRFLRRGSGERQLAKYESIKDAKRGEMRERSANARVYLAQALKDAEIYVNGSEAQLAAKDVTSRISEALGRLVQTVYFKLNYIDTAMGEGDIRQQLRTSLVSQLTLEDDTERNVHAQEDVLGFIQLNGRGHSKTSMKTLKDRFMRAPYGFVEDDIHWLAARLFRQGKLSFTVNGEQVTLSSRGEEELFNYITKKAYVEKLLIGEKEAIKEKDKKAVREILKQLFGCNVVADDEESMMQSFRTCAAAKLRELQGMEERCAERPYPGKRLLSEGRQLLSWANSFQNTGDFYKEAAAKLDDFLDFAEDFEPLQTFFNGTQKEIFDRTLDMLAIYEDSKTYIVDSALEETVAEMKRIVHMPEPFREIPRLPGLREKFMHAYHAILAQEEAPVLDTIRQARERVLEQLSGKPYEAEKQPSYLKLFEEIRDGAVHCNNVSKLRGFSDKADALKLRLLNEMTALDNREQKKADADKPVVRTKNVGIKQVIGTASWRLESRQDVEDCIALLRKNLLAQLDDDTIVNVEF